MYLFDIKFLFQAFYKTCAPNRILLYASDFWGCLKLPKADPIETLHMMMCKHLLGVNKKTTNIGVCLEMGRIPLNIFAIKNWERIIKGIGNEKYTQNKKVVHSG